MKYILFLIFSLVSIVNAATVLEAQDISVVNLLKNPGFENGIAKYTPSVSSTVQLVSGTSALIESTSLRFTATAASQTVQTALYTLPQGLVNGDCESSILYQTNSSVYRMRVLNASGAVISQQALPATSAASTAKMFFPCSVSSTTSVRSDVISSGTASGLGITWDQNHLGSLISSKTSAIVSQWQDYTPTGSWTGTTTYSGKWRRVGSNLEYRIRLALSGAATASSLTINYLPNGLVVNTQALLATSTDGTIPIGTGVTKSAAGVYDVSAYYNGTSNLAPVVKLSSSTYTGVVTNVTNTVPATYASGDNLEIYGSVPIEGWSGTGTTLDSRCPTDLACENNFSTSSGGSGVVTLENLDFINGNCSLSVNVFTCTFNSGIFTVPPNCVVTPEPGATNGIAATVDSISTTTLVYRTFTTTTAANNAQPVRIMCQKQGVDFKTKQVIEGYLSKTMSHSGGAIKRETWGTFGGAGSMAAPAACTSSPCSRYAGDSAMTGTTRSGTGAYSVAIAPGTFTSIESVDVSHSNAANNATTCGWAAATTTSITVNCYNSTSAVLLDAPFSISVKGTR